LWRKRVRQKNYRKEDRVGKIHPKYKWKNPQAQWMNERMNEGVNELLNLLIFYMDEIHYWLWVKKTEAETNHPPPLPHGWLNWNSKTFIQRVGGVRSNNFKAEAVIILIR
jgi:hypothetical protein